MVSSKKKRGKQRKAVVKDIVQLVKKGGSYATHKILDTTNTIILDNNLDGILSAVFGLLQRCEDETFDKVMTDVGGDLRSPTTWIQVLSRAVTLESNCTLQVIQNFGPLVKCMCADTERLFFKSSKYWRESISPFVGMIHDILSEDPIGEGIIDALQQHEALVRSIVQWGFWETCYRPDIVTELKAEDCTKIRLWGMEAASWLVGDEAATKSIMQMAATTPIVSEDYDPTCMVSYVAGLICKLKTNWNAHNSFVLTKFILEANCVDKGVITELVDFGLNYTNDFDTALLVGKLSCNMLLRETNVANKYIQNDTRGALAISSGLIEMCLSFIKRFGMYRSFGSKKNAGLSLYKWIERIFSSTYAISFHQKTAKAIRHKRQAIEEKLACLEDNASITSDIKSKRLLDMVRCILDISGTYCSRCNKSLGRKERKQCNGCTVMTYCSRACQKEDWLSGGHKLSCCKPCTDAQVGQYEGRIDVSSSVAQHCKLFSLTKWKELEINLTMIQLKLFLDNAETILNQTVSLGIDFCDIIVIFDLRQCPPSIKAMHYTEEFPNQALIEGFESSRSKEKITCRYFAHIYNEKVEEDGRIPSFCTQRLFPHEWLKHRDDMLQIHNLLLCI